MLAPLNLRPYGAIQICLLLLLLLLLLLFLRPVLETVMFATCWTITDNNHIFHS